MNKVSSYIFAIRKWQLTKLIAAHKRIKYFNIIILLLSGFMFFNGGLRAVELPNFARYSDWDIWIWAIVLNSLALVQLITLVQCDCKNAYRWSNITSRLS